MEKGRDWASIYNPFPSPSPVIFKAAQWATAVGEQAFDDCAIHDPTQVIAYFNYINRIADALDVEPEQFVRKWEVQ